MIAILTVVYKNYDILDDFFKSLENQLEDCHVYLSDNTENPKNYNYPSYVTCINAENKGYANGINICLKRAISDGYDKFCIINSDIIFSKNFISSLKRSFLSNPKSIIGGKILYAKGYEYHKNNYNENEKGNVIWYAGGKIDWENVYTTHIGVDEIDKGQYDKFEETDFVTGCLMCFDIFVFKKIGLWDISYFLYYEDTDYCIRASKKNINLYYDPSIVIYHKNAQSTDGSGSGIHFFYQEKNRFKFGMSYAPIRTKIHLFKNLLFNKIGIK